GFPGRGGYRSARPPQQPHPPAKIGSPIWVRTSHWPSARRCTANSGKANSMEANIGLAGSARSHAAAAGRDFKRDATRANSTAPNGQGKGPSVFFNSEDQ